MLELTSERAKELKDKVDELSLQQPVKHEDGDTAKEQLEEQLDALKTELDKLEADNAGLEEALARERQESSRGVEHKDTMVQVLFFLVLAVV